jgi:hypothetical protein
MQFGGNHAHHPDEDHICFQDTSRRHRLSTPSAVSGGEGVEKKLVLAGT